EHAPYIPIAKARGFTARLVSQLIARAKKESDSVLVFKGQVELLLKKLENIQPLRDSLLEANEQAQAHIQEMRDLSADALSSIQENLLTAINSINTREKDISTDLLQLQEKITAEIEAIQTHIEETTTAQLEQAQNNIDTFNNEMALRVSNVDHQFREVVKIRDLLQALAKSTLDATDEKLLDLEKAIEATKADLKATLLAFNQNNQEKLEAFNANDEAKTKAYN
ncbi:hypothetical protein, partial [Helicobacter ailurogastricus]|uniref:hypothetical protein n=1 Tax=Helicobacter ailurogastricus TaxID=1578720 RepID=UPI0025534B07